MRALLLVLVLLTACSDAGAQSRQRVVVLAAASLTEVLGELERRYEARHPQTDVVVSTGASSTLAAQVRAGAPAALLLTAGQEVLGALETDAVLAHNRLVVAVPEGNPAGVRGLADLAREELDVALCAPPVPCGAAAREALRRAGVTARPDTLERDVRAVLTRVRLGEVDAALVYATDAVAAQDEVDALPVPSSPVVPYAAVLLDPAARGLLDLLASHEGRAVLTAAGFG